MKESKVYGHPPLVNRIVREESVFDSVFTQRYCGESRGRYRTWDSTSLANAMAAVENGTSVRRAAEIYNIPKSTLHDHVSGKIDFGARSGPSPYLTAEEEEELASFLIQSASIGYPHTKSQVLAIVQQIINGKGIKSCVTNGWWERFRGRHPNLTLRSAVPLGLARSKATDSTVVAKYFDILEETLKANNIMNKPAFIMNCDETGLPLNPTSLKVVDKRGAKNPSYVTGGDRTQITVLACSSAAGFSIPPFVIFDRKTLNPKLTEGEVPGTLYGLSSNGWMNSDLFYHWFLHHFLQYAPQACPLMLLLDGHSSHYCPAFIKLAAEHGVIVFALPPHTSHLTQPLDKGCFSPLKMAWRQVCHEFRTANPGQIVTRYEFSRLFSKAWFKAMTGPNIISSFRITGICPFDRSAIKLPPEFSAFNPESLAKKTGLAYIPLYSPSQSSRSHTISMTAADGEFSPSKSMVPLRSATSISAHLNLPLPSVPSVQEKKSGCVLTSWANLQQIEEKEKKKQDEMKKKEQRKIDRQKKAELKKQLAEERALQKKFNSKQKPKIVEESSASSEDESHQTACCPDWVEAISDCFWLEEEHQSDDELHDCLDDSLWLENESPDSVDPASRIEAISNERGKSGVAPTVKGRRKRCVDFSDSAPSTVKGENGRPGPSDSTPVAAATVKGRRNRRLDSTLGIGATVKGRNNVHPDSTNSAPGIAGTMKGRRKGRPDSTDSAPGIAAAVKSRRNRCPDSTDSAPGGAAVVNSRRNGRPYPTDLAPGVAATVKSRRNGRPDPTDLAPGVAATAKSRRHGRPDPTDSAPGVAATVKSRRNERPDPTDLAPGVAATVKSRRNGRPDPTDLASGVAATAKSRRNGRPDPTDSAPGVAATVKSRRNGCPDPTDSAPGVAATAKSRRNGRPDPTDSAPGIAVGVEGRRNGRPDPTDLAPRIAAAVKGRRHGHPDSTGLAPGIAATVKGRKNTEIYACVKAAVEDRKSSMLPISAPGIAATVKRRRHERPDHTDWAPGIAAAVQGRANIDACEKGTVNDGKSPMCPDPCLAPPTEGPVLLVKGKKENTDLIMVSEDEGSGDDADNWWIRELHLYESDRSTLSQDMYISDAVVNAAQSLLKAQYHNFSGFQNTFLSQGLKFTPIHRNSNSIQILNTDNSHWICASTTRNSQYIQVWDSLSMGFSIETVLQLAKLYSLPANHSKLLIKHQSVQQQQGAADCGLFAIAFAVELCCGRDPGKASFLQHKMRQHLQLCLSKGIVVAFPRALTELVPRPKGGILTVQIFCICKMPAQFDSRMIQCDSCNKWYHYSCMNIDSFQVPEAWDCPLCVNEK